MDEGRGVMGNEVHGHSKNGGSPTYKVWYSMLHRCHNQKNKRFSSYGGRGVIVCDRWHIFENFLHDMGQRPVGMTLDRINNDGNYEPSNCRWATIKEQSRNTSRTKRYTINGISKCLKDWADFFGISYSILLYRINKKGMSFEESVTEKIEKPKQYAKLKNGTYRVVVDGKYVKTVRTELDAISLVKEVNHGL